MNFVVVSGVGIKRVDFIYIDQKKKCIATDGKTKEHLQLITVELV